MSNTYRGEACSRSNRGPNRAEAASSRAGSPIANAAAAIFVAPAAAPAPAPSDALSALFDLTAAEARVFSKIAAGKTLAEAAGDLGVEASTAKTHLLRVFNKTGTHRQAELVKLAASLSMPA